MSEPSEADDLRRQMAQVRGALHQATQGLVIAVRGMVDWRPRVRQYAWVGLFAAAAVGYVLVPRRTRVFSLEADALEELGRRGGMCMIARPASAVGLGGSVAKVLAQMAMRASLAYIGKRAKQRFLDRTAESHDVPTQPR